MFIWVRVDSLECDYGSFGFAYYQLSAPSGRRVHSGSRGFTRASLWISAHRCRRVQSGSYGITRARLVVTGFIRVRVGSLGHAKESPGSFLFEWYHSGGRSGRRVHSGLRGFTRARQGVTEFIPVYVGLLGRT